MKGGVTYRWGLAALFSVLLEALLWAMTAVLWWALAEFIPALRFNRPEMAWGLLAGPLALLLFILDTAWRDRAIKRFASSATQLRVIPAVSGMRNLTRYALLRVGLLLAAVALLEPQLGSRPEEVKAKGIDLVLALDVSNSMDCEDLRPSRMVAAKRAMEQLVDRLGGDRLGIVIFAGDAFVQLPITTDRAAARLFIRTIGTGSVPNQGTAIGAAIDLARRAFDTESAAGKAIIVITDGENHEDDAASAAQAAAAAGIVVHTVGMGTPEGGPIPLRRNGQLQGFRKDRSGTTVVTRLDEALLRRIAQEGNGTFVRATASSTGILELVDQLKAMEQSDTGTIRYTAHEAQFQWPLGAAMVCFLLYLLLGERRNPRSAWRTVTA